MCESWNFEASNEWNNIFFFIFEKKRKGGTGNPRTCLSLMGHKLITINRSSPADGLYPENKKQWQYDMAILNMLTIFLKIFLLKTFTRSGWATGNLCSSQLLKCSTIFREDYCRLHGPGRQANVWQLSKSPIKFYSCGPVTWWPQQGSGPCGRFILFQPAAETENSSFKRKSIHRSLSNLNAIASINSKWRLF